MVHRGARFPGRGLATGAPDSEAMAELRLTRRRPIWSTDLDQLDRVEVVVPAPLTTNEAWTALAPGELKVFVDGVTVAEKS
jgi:predicted glutamine amidotransferase